MTRYRIVLAAVGMALAGGTLAATAEPSGYDPDNMTCKQLTEAQPQMQSRLIYWIDGHSGRPGVATSKEWFGVPDDEFLEACRAHPSQLVTAMLADKHREHDTH